MRDEKKAVLVRERQRLFDAEARLAWLIEAYNSNSAVREPAKEPLKEQGQLASPSITPSSITSPSITPPSVTLEQMLLSNAYAERLKREIAEIKIQIIELEKSVQAALGEYLTANQEVRSLETLRDKRRQEYEELVQREEAKFLDELATQGAARNGGEL